MFKLIFIDMQMRCLVLLFLVDNSDTVQPGLHFAHDRSSCFCTGLLMSTNIDVGRKTFLPLAEYVSKYVLGFFF